jgi:hypothetical protein
MLANISHAIVPTIQMILIAYFVIVRCIVSAIAAAITKF